MVAGPDHLAITDVKDMSEICQKDHGTLQSTMVFFHVILCIVCQFAF